MSRNISVSHHINSITLVKSLSQSKTAWYDAWVMLCPLLTQISNVHLARGADHQLIRNGNRIKGQRKGTKSKATGFLSFEIFVQIHWSQILHVMITGGTFHLRGQIPSSKKFFMKFSNSLVGHWICKPHKSMPSNTKTSCGRQDNIWQNVFRKSGFPGEQKYVGGIPSFLGVTHILTGCGIIRHE